jgi:hypothetical protein
VTNCACLDTKTAISVLNPGTSLTYLFLALQSSLKTPIFKDAEPKSSPASLFLPVFEDGAHQNVHQMGTYPTKYNKKYYYCGKTEVTGLELWHKSRTNNSTKP